MSDDTYKQPHALKSVPNQTVPTNVDAPSSLAQAPSYVPAIEIETLEYAAHLCRRCDGLALQAAWKIEAIIERLSQQKKV
jgi:hypothetical protein